MRAYRWTTLSLALFILGSSLVVLGACDSSREVALPDGALAQWGTDQIVALKSDSEMRALISEVAIENRLVGPDLSNWEDVSFEHEGNRPYLVARGKTDDGNCISVALPLNRSDTSRESGKYLVLAKEVGHTCTGAPCDACAFTYVGGEIHGCTCSGTGGGEPGHCNHTLSEVTPPGQGDEL